MGYVGVITHLLTIVGQVQVFLPLKNTQTQVAARLLLALLAATCRLCVDSSDSLIVHSINVWRNTILQPSKYIIHTKKEVISGVWSISHLKKEPENDGCRVRFFLVNLPLNFRGVLARLFWKSCYLSVLKHQGKAPKHDCFKDLK